MILENKNIGIVFIGNFYIKDNLLIELNKMSQKSHINITPIFEKESNKEKQSDICKRNSIFKNKAIFYLNNEIDNISIKRFDILIFVGFTIELLYKLNYKIFDNSIVKLIKMYEKENIPIILGLKTNIDIFIVFEQIKKLYNKSKYYFIPMIFPNPITKPELIIFDPSMISKTTEHALNKIQINPIISCNYI